MNIVYKLNGKEVSREQFAADQPARFDAMVAAGRAPAALTDREFLEGRCNGNQFERLPEVGDFYKGQAAAAGVDTTGKVYVSGLASFPGDPKAWVSGRGDAQRLLEERGWGADGAVTTPLTNVAEPDAKYRVADDLVADAVADELEGQPVAETDVEATEEKVRKRLSPDWK